MVQGKKQSEAPKMSERDYRALSLLSSSSLRLYDSSPRQFYKENVLGEVRKEKLTSSMLLGSLCHCMLLEDSDAFDSKFYLTTCTKPTGLMLLFVESLYEHTLSAMNEEGEVTEEFGELCRLAYIDSGYKLSMDKVISKFSGSNAEEYYKELRSSKANGLEVVTLDDLGIANKIVEMVKNDEFLGYLFREDSPTEVKIEGFEIDELPMKAMIDLLRIDREQRTLQVIDLKVVYSIEHFYQEYFLKKRADIQAYVYQKALESGKADLGFDYSDYVLLPPAFLTIDSGCFNRPVLRQLSFKDLQMAYEGFEENGRVYRGTKDIISDILWSQSMNLWGITKDVYNNKGVINIRK